MNQFARLGLLREVGVDGAITFFDTNTRDHHHFFVEGENEIRDIPTTDILIGKMAEIPDGYEIARVDLMIRLRRSRQLTPRSGGLARSPARSDVDVDVEIVLSYCSYDGFCQISSFDEPISCGTRYPLGQ